jgi:bifunctional non-homologous end joining protein LigD
LLLGLYDNEGRFVHVGEVAGGFDDASAKTVLDFLNPLQTRQCPFDMPPLVPRLIFWCRPQAVCRVRFGGWTPTGKLRFTVFVILRPDVPPSECRLERLQPA